MRLMCAWEGGIRNTKSGWFQRYESIYVNQSFDVDLDECIFNTSNNDKKLFCLLVYHFSFNGVLGWGRRFWINLENRETKRGGFIDVFCFCELIQVRCVDGVVLCFSLSHLYIIIFVSPPYFSSRWYINNGLYVVVVSFSERTMFVCRRVFVCTTGTSSSSSSWVDTFVERPNFVVHFSSTVYSGITWYSGYEIT